MSTVPSNTAPIHTAEFANAANETRRERVDAFFERWSDRINPIVVKECRQALKSRQFFASFILTLAACWTWSLIATWDGNSGNSRYGLQILSGYFAILAFPLMVIVPFCAFRSLNLERDDKTFELLAVTTLPPSKIVLGKLVGALVQIALYVSATLPCFAFSALLRSVDLPTMFYGLFYLIINSLCFACFGLMVGAVIRDRFLQMPATVILLAVAFYFFGMTVAASSAFIFRGTLSRMMLDDEFHAVNLGYVAANLSSCALFLSVAVTQITFAGGNRSTAPRIFAFVQHLLFLGWLTYFVWLMSGRDYWNGRLIEEMGAVAIIGVGVYWYTIGIFLTGEPERLSPRVRRGLPDSLLGRAFLGGFYPGPGRGFLYASANMMSVCIGVVVVDRMLGASQGMFMRGEMTYFAMAAWGYLTIYLGFGLLVFCFLGRRMVVNLFLRALIHVLLFFASILTSVLLMESFNRGGGYPPEASLGTLINPFMTLMYVMRHPSHDVSAVIVFVSAIIVTLCNLPGIVAEFKQNRMTQPERVLADILATRKTLPSGPSNPWDQPDDELE